MSREKIDNNQGRENINIKYMAKVAGVSPSTVSRALRGDPTANKNTAERILKIAKDLNYYPNLLAKGLRYKKSKTIGIILNDLENPYYYETIKLVEDKLNNLDYTMILCDSNYDINLERKNIITMLSKGVDGIIISPVNIKSNNIQLIMENKLKTVFIDFSPEYKNINYVHVSHEKASYLSTRYLLNKGHKNILLLNGPSQLSVSQNFLKGYQQALKDYGLKIKTSMIKNSVLSVDQGFEIIHEIYQKNSLSENRFTAITSISDLLAIGVYEASKKIGFKIPDDISVVGYDDIYLSSYLSPPLTTINVPKIQIGELSIKILLDQIEGKDLDYHKIILDVRLIERESVKDLNK